MARLDSTLFLATFPLFLLMRAYFLRRLLLVPLTLFGVTFLVFSLTRILPGGPLEKRMQAAMMAQEGHGSGKSLAAQSVLNDRQLLGLKRTFLLDKPVWQAFLMWWGILPSEVGHRDAEGLAVPKEGEEPTKQEVYLPSIDKNGNLISQRAEIIVNHRGELSLALADGNWPSDWNVREETQGGSKEAAPEGQPKEIHAVAYRKEFRGVLQWDFRYSVAFGEPVWDLIKARMPISLFYGLITVILTYAVCIPLGALKAIKHRTFVDSATSVLIFVGYAIPGFALGTILLLVLAFRLEWFPMGGFTSPEFAKLSSWGKIKDLLHHAVLPLLCYIVHGFALTTMLMKNNLLDNLAADYVRTAVAKGSTFRHAVLGHAMRNSLIPIGTTFGLIVMTLVSGSMLVETVFDIQGFGVLTFRSMIDADYPVVLAMIFLSALLMMIGNLLSDLIVAWLNPRIRFE